MDTPTPVTDTPVENTTPVEDTTPATEETTEARTFTQEDIDEIVSKRLARERARYERDLEEVKANAGKTEIELAQARAEKAEATATSMTEAMNTALTRAAAVEAAYTLDANPAKMDAILKLADMPAPGEDGVDAAGIAKAIEAVLTENPEWKRTPVKGTGLPVGAGDRSVSTPPAETTSIEDAVSKYFG